MDHLQTAELPLLRGLGVEPMSLLQSLMTPCVYECDTMIFEQGQDARFLYILVQGEVTVRYKAYDGPLMDVSKIEAGGVVGWSAALGRASYTSGAMCTQPCKLLRIEGKSLRAACKRYPASGALIMDRFASIISVGISSTHEQVFAILMQGPDEQLD
jgi:CRP-like cAMP-binding protein